MRSATIGELLTSAQLKELEKTLKAMEKEGVDPMDPAFTARLKALFAPWKDDLETKGVVADYLAYMVCYIVSKGKGVER